MEETVQDIFTPQLIDEAMSYEEYRDLLDELLEQNQTTGSNHSGEMIEYTQLNVKRMSRMDKTVQIKDSLREKLQNVSQHWIWLVLTEGWCGDAAQNVPIIQQMAEHAPSIDTKYILRDEHLDVMDQYLTNGGRSIPKLICLDAETLDEVGTWGPRPGDFQQKVMRWMNDPELSQEEWGEKLHSWYAKDKGQTIQADFEALIEQWS